MLLNIIAKYQKVPSLRIWMRDDVRNPQGDFLEIGLLKKGKEKKNKDILNDTARHSNGEREEHPLCKPGLLERQLAMRIWHQITIKDGDLRVQALGSSVSDLGAILPL